MTLLSVQRKSICPTTPHSGNKEQKDEEDVGRGGEKMGGARRLLSPLSRDLTLSVR